MPNISYIGGTGLKFESQKVKIILKMHLNAIFIAFWQKFESRNLAVARKVLSMDSPIQEVCLTTPDNLGHSSYNTQHDSLT